MEDPRPFDSFIAERLFGWKFRQLPRNSTCYPWETPWGEAAAAPDYARNTVDTMNVINTLKRDHQVICHMGHVIPEIAAKDGETHYCEFGFNDGGKTKRWNAFGRTFGEAVVLAAMAVIKGRNIGIEKEAAVEDAIKSLKKLQEGM